MLEPAGNISKGPLFCRLFSHSSLSTHVDLSEKRITSRHLELAVRGDEDLVSLIQDTMAVLNTRHFCSFRRFSGESLQLHIYIPI
jgi:hypothetical protein